MSFNKCVVLKMNQLKKPLHSLSRDFRFFRFLLMYPGGLLAFKSHGKLRMATVFNLYSTIYPPPDLNGFTINGKTIPAKVH